MASRWRWPPESTPGAFPVLSARPNRSSRSRALVSACFRGVPATMAGSVTFSSTLIPSSRLKNWKTIPMCFLRMRARSFSSLPASDSPDTATSPSVGVSNPATRFSRVDFPQPDGPITATNSPSCMVRSTPRSARTGAAWASALS